ncbi:TetR/AcrR family transcriptional regulator C-terminal domain-containing protein [Nocardia sp. CWNU-33]|uniref:TetR/AcrR family transcriptional regulator C-terminal domain-containing protein n=1 Tax=Nocardia sp. CWNU-33 TaxID=3392117 RepID=UPI00398E46CC
MSDRKRPAPSGRTTLNRDYIATVALTVIDEAGIDGFTMRKLGAALGADPMAAYRHFTDQQDLFDAIAAAMFAELEMETLPWQEDWPELMRTYAYRLRSTLRRHPNAVPIFATRPVRSATSVETGNWMLERLQGVGFPAAIGLQLARCLREYVIGHILSHTVATVAAQRSRTPAADSDGHRARIAAVDAVTNTDHFEIGLTAMLDGFGKHLD